MRSVSKRLITAASVLVCLLVPAVAVRAQSSCQADRHVLEGHHALVFYLGGIPGSDVTLHLEVIVDSSGNAQAHGSLPRQFVDGTSNTIAFSEGQVNVACGDVNGDGFAGVTAIVLDMLDVRTRDVLQVSIVPDDREIDATVEVVTIVFGNVTVSGEVRFKPLFAFHIEGR